MWLDLVISIHGKYTGSVTADTDEKICVKDLTGWCEEHKAKW